ncbi:MAG: efflux RND transporter permease subunit [Chlamydiae bacterium]|nr:efflux RND transporter permease subunit [Chlamydiota bacterium]
MNLSLPFIKRPVMTTLLMVLLVVFGLICYAKLPVSSIPSISYPTIEVNVSYPGASSDTMAKLISSPLERQFLLMEGIKMVSSSNTYESTSIILTFHLDVDINVGAQETEEAIQKALAQLPNDLPQNPTYTKVNPSDTPIYYLVLHSPNLPSWSLYEYGFNFLGQQIGTIEGVANIEVFGYPYAVRVQIDPEACAAKEVSLEEVAYAISNQNPMRPTGKFYGPNKSISTIVDGQIRSAKEYNSLIIKYQDKQPVRLSDIGHAFDSPQNDKQVFSWLTKQYPEGENSAVIAIYRSRGYNTVDVCKDITSLVDVLKTQLPQGISMSVPFTLQTWILEAVEDVKLTLLVAFFLVVFVVYLYLGKIKDSIIPLITIPITIIGTFIFMYAFGYSLDILSLSAITLGIGFLVDDAIVVLENCVRFIQKKGLTPYEGAIEGSFQIIITVVSISLCLAAVFIPMLFIQGAIGQMFHEFAAVILISVLLSAVISLSLTPMLCSRFIPAREEGRKGKVEKFSYLLNQKMVDFYLPLLKWALKRKIWIFGFGSLCVVLSMMFLLIIPREFLPPEDLGIIQGFAQAPEGTSPAKMSQYMKEISDTCIESPYIDSFAKLQSTPTDNQSVFFINLVERNKRPDIWSCIKQIQESVNENVIGANFAMKAYPLINLQIGDGQSGKANYQYTLQSFNDQSLYHAASEFIDKLQQIPEITNVNSNFQPNSPTLHVKLLRDQAKAYNNISALDIENTFAYAYGETYISKINASENTYYVILESLPDFDQNPSNLKNLYTKTTAIESIIDSQIITKPETVNHINALPSVTVVFDNAPGVPLSVAVNKVENLAKEVLPDDVMGSIAGNTQEFKKSTETFIVLVFASIFVIYIILGILYEDFIHPLSPLSAIPVAILGGLFSLLLCGKTLSIYGLIGIIMLLGIVMKNGILLVDFALEEMQKGLGVDEAIYNACETRFRPIMMTTLATMMGSIPVALGIGGTIAEGRAPLGIVVVGGLIFSQAVTLFVIPCMFCYMCKFREKILKK